MEQREIMRRVVGILTESLELRRQVREDPDADSLDAEGVIGEMLTEMLPRIELPADATPQEIATIVSRELAPAVERMAAAFAFAFVHLAEIHDEGQAGVSSADALRSLSLHFENKTEGP